jgi:hypothetical protein
VSDSIISELRRTGGIMGLDETVIVRGDGSAFSIACRRSREDFELDGEQLEGLREDTMAADLPGNAGKEFAEGEVRDGYRYSIRADSAVVRFGDGAKDVPKRS